MHRKSVLALAAALAARAHLSREAAAVRALAALGPPPGTPVAVSFFHDGLPKDARFVLSKGNWGLAAANRPQDSFTSKKYKGFLGNAVVPPANQFRDNLDGPGFTIPVLATTNVSGGGNALQTAIAAAAAGTRLLVTDSLNYNVISFSAKTNITVEADSGQTPTITAAAGPSGHCVEIGAGNSGIHLKGIHFIGNGNVNTLSQDDNGLVLGTTNTGMTASTFDRLIVENCIFTDLDPANGVPGIQLIGTDGSQHTNVLVIGCTLTDMAAPAFTAAAAYGIITIGGFGSVFIQNSKMNRNLVARGDSQARGIVLKNVTSTIQDVLADDIGVSAACFKHAPEAAFGSVVGGTSTWKNCVAVNSRGAFLCTKADATMIVEHPVCYNDTAGLAAGATFVRFTVGTMSCVGGVILGAGDGTAFSATITESQNDVFNVGANGKVLDASDLTVDPLLSDPANNDYRATNPSVSAGGPAGTPMGVYYPGGTVIFWAGVP